MMSPEGAALSAPRKAFGLPFQGLAEGCFFPGALPQAGMARPLGLTDQDHMLKHLGSIAPSLLWAELAS